MALGKTTPMIRPTWQVERAFRSSSTRKEIEKKLQPCVLDPTHTLVPRETAKGHLKTRPHVGAKRSPRAAVRGDWLMSGTSLLCLCSGRTRSRPKDQERRGVTLTQMLRAPPGRPHTQGPRVDRQLSARTSPGSARSVSLPPSSLSPL